MADDPVRAGLHDGAFDLQAEVSRVKGASRETGGVVTFLGIARDLTDGRKVVGLEFESYGEMADRELRGLADEAMSRFGLLGLTILHRTGPIPAGEDIVLIVAGAAHREAAFAACRWSIDELKRRVPIWKKEIFTDGEVWVQETP